MNRSRERRFSHRIFQRLRAFFRHRPPSSSSWTETVRRVNSQYRLTVEALEQMKISFQQIEVTKVDKQVQTTFEIFNKPKLVRHIEHLTTIEEISSENDSQEETTYTVETFYRNPKENFLIIREKTTEEQFNQIASKNKGRVQNLIEQWNMGRFSSSRTV